MKGFFVLAFIFVIVMVGMKACSGGMASLKNPFGGGGKPGTAAVVSGGGGKSVPPVVGVGYVMQVEKFRGWVGGLGELRTDAGQYRVGALCVHGLVQRVADRQAIIKGPSGLVVVVAVDDYTRPELVEDEKEEKEPPNFLANKPAEKPMTLVSSVPVKVVSGSAPPMAAVPASESLKLTSQQKRQAVRGVLVKGPFSSGIKMGP